MELGNWKTLYKKESWGSHNFGIEIRVALDRQPNENDERAMYKIADEIEHAVMSETVRLDPSAIAERDAEQKHLMECFPEGMNIFAEAIPNGYCSRYCCIMSPWYKVTTPKGVITLGWRKRVISITWDVRVTGGVDADNVFPNEDVTKITERNDGGFPIGYTIHAWGYDKAKQYLATILGFYTPEK